MARKRLDSKDSFKKNQLEGSGAHAAPPEPELEPDAWERFKRAIRQIGKAGVRHRPKPFYPGKSRC